MPTLPILPTLLSCFLKKHHMVGSWYPPVEARSAGGRAGFGRWERERREESSPTGELKHKGTRKSTCGRKWKWFENDDGWRWQNWQKRENLNKRRKWEEKRQWVEERWEQRERPGEFLSEKEKGDWSWKFVKVASSHKCGKQRKNLKERKLMNDKWRRVERRKERKGEF